MKNFLLVPAMLVVLGCNFLFGVPATATVVIPPTVQSVALPTPSSAPDNAATEPVPAPAHGYVEVRLHSRDGALRGLLAVESQKAVAMGMMPVVEFDANW
jgi:hypothetical protein